MKLRFLATLFALLLPTISLAQNYTIGTGGQAGTYYPFGGALAQVWSDEVDNFNVKAEVSAASVENTIKVVKGDMIAGLAMGNVVLDAYQGVGKFPAKMPVNVLFALYPNLVHTVTKKDSGISTLADLKGKRISLGAPGSGTAVTSAALLESVGIDVEKDIKAVYLKFSETTNAISNGQIDAGFLVASQGVGAVTQLALTQDIRVIPVSDAESKAFIETYPAYSSYTIPGGTYKGVDDAKTLSIWNVLVVKQDMDDKMAYDLTKAAYENMDKVQRVVKAANATTPANATRLAGVPLHPGAKKYLDEQK